MSTVDMSDTMRALVQHATSGELYVVEIASVWDEQECVGAEIVAGTGPITTGDLGVERPLEPSRELFDRIDDLVINPDGDDTEWFQAEDAAGRWLYPIGARKI